MRIFNILLYLIIIITITIKEIDSDSKELDTYQLPLRPVTTSESSEGSSDYGNGSLTPSFNYVEGSPTMMPTTSISPTNIPITSQSPTNNSPITSTSPSISPSISPSKLPTMMPTTFPTNIITKAPTPRPTTLPEIVLIAEMTSFEFYIYNTTITNKSDDIISNAVSKYILQTTAKLNVSIDSNINGKRNMKSRRNLQEIDNLNSVMLYLMTPFKNVFGQMIDSKTASNKLSTSITNGQMQQTLRNSSDDGSSLRWVVVCNDVSCNTKVNYITNSKSKEPCSKVPTVYDKYYGWNASLQGYIVWLILLILIWFGISIVTICALFSRYYSNFDRIYDIKCFTSFCRRSNRATLQSILETSKFFTGCLVFNCAITRLWSLIMIIILTMQSLGVTNFACAEFSIIKSNKDEFSKVYVLVYALFYPILVLSIVGRQIWHDSEMRNVGLVHLMFDARMHLAISIILRKVTVFIALLCLILLLTLLIATFAIDSSKILVIIQSVQLVCAIFIFIIQSYRIYGLRNIRLEIRSPLDCLNNLNKTKTLDGSSARNAIHNNVVKQNRFYISSSLDDCKDDDYLNRIESEDSSEKDDDDDDEQTYRPQVSDNLSITFSIITAILSIITAVPYLFDKALLALIVFSVITRIFEIFTICSLLSTFKVTNMSLQQLIARELNDKVNRVLNSSLPSSIANLYRSSIAEFQEKDYMYEVSNDMNPFQCNDVDSQSLISDITLNTKQQSYMQLSHEREQMMIYNETIVDIKNEDKITRKNKCIDDGTPKWIKKWEQSGKHRKIENYDDLQYHIPADIEKAKVDEDVFNSQSSASSFGSHWRNLIDIVKEDIGTPNKRNKSLIRTPKLEI